MARGVINQKYFISRRWIENNQEARTGGRIFGKKYMQLYYIYRGTALEGIQVIFFFALSTGTPCV